MAKNIQSLQLLRNGTLFADKVAAKNALTGFTTSNQPSTDMDGVAVLARYGSEGNVKTLVGFYYSSGSTTTVTIFDSEALADAESKINNIISGVGLNENGTYSANTGNAYTSDATSVADAVDKLDAAISAVSATVDSTSASTVSGESKVVIDVTQEKGKITATAANITGVKLDGYTVGGDDSAKIESGDTLGQALGKLQGQINGMDLAAVGASGSVITSVSEADGKVSASATPLTDITLVGFEADSGLTGDVAARDSVKVALNKLQNKIVASQSATTVASSGNSISVSTATSGTNIDVHIQEGEKVLASSGSGLYTDIKLSAVTLNDANVKEAYQLIATNGDPLGETIKIYKDSAYKEIYLGTSADTIDKSTGEITKQEGDKQSLNYAYMKADGTYDLVKVDVSKFLAESEFKDGLEVADHVVNVKVDSNSEKDSQATPADFLTVGVDGVKIQGIKAEIDRKIAALDVSGDNAVDGQYIAAIEEADGIVSAKTRANVSEAVLNNYAKGSDANAIAATDTVNQALSKLENQVDAAKAAATTKVVEGTDAGDHLSISSATGADGSVTYTINLSDVASASALTTETAAREAADTELSNRLGTGVTTANTATAQLAALSGTTEDPSSATSIAGAKKYTDEKVAALSGKSITAITSANNSISATSSTADGSVTYDLVTDASKIQMSGFTAAESGFTAISESSSVTEAFKAVESYVLETEEVTAAALTDLDARIKAITSDTSTQGEVDAIEAAVGLGTDGSHQQSSGNYTSGASTIAGEIAALDTALKAVDDKYVSGATMNGTAVPKSNKVLAFSATSMTSQATAVGNEAIVITTDNNGGLTFGIATLDCGTY